MLGHDPQYPVLPHWPMQVKELADWIRARTHVPVWGVGHSFGAVISFLTAYQYPELFRGIVLLDPPLISGWNALLFAMARQMGMADQMTPAGRSRTRRRHWATYEEAVTYFQSRPFYQQLDARCLADYISAGVRELGDGSWTLTYDPDVEVEIFRTTPHDYWRYWRHLKVPGILIRGSHSEVTQPKAAYRLAHTHGLIQQECPGGHLFPLITPEQTAQQVHQGIALLQKMSRIR